LSYRLDSLIALTRFGPQQQQQHPQQQVSVELDWFSVI